MCVLVQASEGGEEAMPEEERIRRGEVLLELASASPQSLERLIKQHRKDIDEELLEQLYARIQVARQFDEVGVLQTLST